MTTYTKLFRNAAVAVIFVFSAICVALYLSRDARNGTYSQLLLLSGCCGTTVANYQRLMKLYDKKVPESELPNGWVAFFQIITSLVVGGIFSLVLWAAFFSGLLEGALFPKYHGTKCPYTNFGHLMSTTHPEFITDAAKGIFWSFVAGYAEKFVPNILDGLAANAQREAGAKND